MAHKSKTLELADALEKNGDGCTCCAYASFECCCNAVWGSDYTREAAAEIRRLHEENVYLRDVYQSLVQDRSELFDDLDKAVAAEREACAAIAEKELGNTAMLTSMPPKSSAAWNILFAIRARNNQHA